LTVSGALAQSRPVVISPCTTAACVKAPEIDPVQALGALTLLSGTVAIIRGYRRRQK